MGMNNDVVIIGGGINGTSIAYHLSKRGISVLLLEKGFIAGGPTGLSSAIVRQHYSNPITARMALRSLHIWQNFPDLIGGDIVFTKTGFLIGVRPEDIDGLIKNIGMQKSVGVNTRFVSPQEIKEIEPHIELNGIGGAAYEPESGYCDPAASANGFAQAAQRYGATIRTGIRVTGFVVEKGKINAIVTDAGRVTAGKVIIASGPWSKGMLEEIGVRLPFITARVKVVIYQRPDDFKRHGIWGDFISQVYLRPESGGMMLVGSISPDEETADQVYNPNQYNEKVELSIISSFAERVALRFPPMQRSHLASSYASLYDITTDWHPIIDAVPGVEGLYLCAGTSGHGFKLAPAVGEMMADFVMHGKGPEDDINLFAFDRFENGPLVQGQYEYSILG